MHQYVSVRAFEKLAISPFQLRHSRPEFIRAAPFAGMFFNIQGLEPCHTSQIFLNEVR